MKFIHTSDWHIGRQFCGVSLLDDQRHVLNQLLNHIEQEAIDALVIAGDIYDRSVPPTAAVECLDNLLTTICIDRQVPIILIPGNHDSAERLRFGSRQLSKAGLHIMGDLANVTEPVIIPAKHGEVAFYGIPYNDPEMVRHTFSQAVKTYDDAHTFLVERIQNVKLNTRPNVLVSHCFLDGAEASDSERPLSIGGSDRVSYQPCESFDYVALGHLHSPQYKGHEHIRYSGSLLKYSFSEQHQRKGVTLVEMDEKGLKRHKHLPLEPLRDMRVIEGQLSDLLEQGKVDPNHEDYLFVRLTDQHALLDPMAKLREVYPNVLQLEKLAVLATGEKLMNREKLNRGELDMFRDFFKQVSGSDLTEEQDQAIAETISELLKQETQA